MAVHCRFLRDARACHVVADIGHARFIFFAWGGGVLSLFSPVLMKAIYLPTLVTSAAASAATAVDGVRGGFLACLGGRKN
jgi:hypothetical protein